MHCHKKRTICLCLCLTLGSLTCLALPAWLNTVPSFLFCSHLCPLLFDNPDRHARWVTRTCPSLVCVSSHLSIRPSERGVDVLTFFLTSSDICLSIFVCVSFCMLKHCLLCFFKWVKKDRIFWHFLFCCPLCYHSDPDCTIYPLQIDQNLLDALTHTGNLYMHICALLLYCRWLRKPFMQN